MFLKKLSGFIILVWLLDHNLQGQEACFLQRSTPWADSLLKTMTLEEQIGQLFMVAAWSDPMHKEYDPTGVDQLVKNYHIGGLIFMQGSPGRQAILTNRYQSHSEIPMMIGMDAEWGLGMRLDSTISYPRQMTLGAMNDDSVVYRFGAVMAQQLKRLGVHVSFSPVVDINNNPKNPVISNRSFGQDKHKVTTQSLMYMSGLQDNGILACAKHFPGHGDTETDSHKDLPIVAHDFERLDSLELYPYKFLLDKGLGSVMTAHLFAPALDTGKSVAATLSPKVINGLLRNDMGFDGLIFTDAMNMQGVAKFFRPGEIEVKALMAGNDVLLFSQNVPLAIDRIRAAVDSGLVSREEIAEHCLRILRAKEWAGLDKIQQVKVSNIYQDLNNAEAVALKKEITEKSLTILKSLPLENISGKRVAIVSVGVEEPTEFSASLSHYYNGDIFVMEKNPDFRKAMWWRDTLSTYDIVIAGLLNTSNKASKNFGITNEASRILNSAGEQTHVVMAVFANPYSLEVLRELNNIESVIVGYQDDAVTQVAMAELVAGAIDGTGNLPVDASAEFRLGYGIIVNGNDILRWTDNGINYAFAGQSSPQFNGSPAGDYEEDMMNDVSTRSRKMQAAVDHIDTIAESGINKGAYPGCRVLVVKNGQVVYDKAFGTLDWDKKSQVEENTVYDLASITKVASSTLAAMKLVDEGLLDVNKTLGDYLDIPADNDYSKVVIRNMMSHCAGFTPWIPFYQETLEGGKPDPAIYSNKPMPGFSTEVAEGMYIMDTYRDSIFRQILATPVSSEKTYKYSDIGYYFLQRIIEKQSGKPLDQYVTENFYNPMGLSTMGYKPMKRISKSKIAPTEDDRTFRQQHIRGYVHDQGAAMMGGVAGHAGLFSNAQDLAAIMQMLCNEGSYGGRQYLTKSTIDLFNTRHFPGNRRGIGFDKPSLTPGSGSTAREATASSFGHTGFTGTMCWADPDKGLVYVFLSNRVDPDAENKKLQDMNIRTEIQEEIYRVWGN